VNVTPAPAVEAREIHKSFDGGVVHALDGLTLTVAPGEYVAITGPSGCGKSTLLHLLAALDRPDAGTRRVAGLDLATLDDPNRYRRVQVGLVFQLHNLLPHLGVLENVEIVMFATSANRHDQRARAWELLAAVDLADLERRRPPRCRAGSVSASPSLEPWPTTPGSSSPTSRPAASTVARCSACSSCCATCARASASPSSSSPTTPLGRRRRPGHPPARRPRGGRGRGRRLTPNAAGFPAGRFGSRPGCRRRGGGAPWVHDHVSRFGGVRWVGPVGGASPPVGDRGVGGVGGCGRVDHAVGE